MVTIREGDEPAKVPIVYYDKGGNRKVVGEAAVQIKNNEVIALGQLTEKARLNATSGISISGLSFEAFSMEVGPTPIEEASARLGILRTGRNDHVTPRNPSGEAKVCGRRDRHANHEWYVHPADFFTVYCPGKGNQ